MNKLDLYAGQEAYAAIRENGLTPEMVSGVVSAAGGPKWFTTYGLTRYIIGELLREAAQELHFLGASVGSWQMTAALTADPIAAIDRLRVAYCTSIYSDDPDASEISATCGEIISAMIHDEAEYILSHTSRRLHVVTARGKGWLSHPSKILRGGGFAVAYVANTISRRLLRHVTERVIFSYGATLPYDVDIDDLPTHQASLTPHNIHEALRASGSIPFMMEGGRDISGGPTGMYWDGGMTDYHIALPYDVSGIILHPHFMPQVLPGWFDKKSMRRRRAHSAQMSKVLLVVPSEEYIASLPRGQISDMKDFYYYGTDQQARIRYWTEISERSLELGEELKSLITSGDIVDKVRPYKG